jgi:cyclic-di-GMP-binding protein
MDALCRLSYQGVRRRSVATASGAVAPSACRSCCVVGAGFEPAKAEPPGLQPGPFGHSGIPPRAGKGTRSAGWAPKPSWPGLGGPPRLPSDHLGPRPALRRGRASATLSARPAALHQPDVQRRVHHGRSELRRRGRVRPPGDRQRHQPGGEARSATRFDFKDTDTIVEWSGEDAITAGVRLRGPGTCCARGPAGQVRQAEGLAQGPRRRATRVRSAGAVLGIDVKLVTTMPADLAKAIVKDVKASKLKVTPDQHGRQGPHRREVARRPPGRSSSSSLAQDHPAPLRFTNYR